MKKDQREIDNLTERIIDLLCEIQEEEIKKVLEIVYEVRLRQNDLSCDEDSDDEDQTEGSGSDTDDNSFFETSDEDS